MKTKFDFHFASALVAAFALIGSAQAQPSEAGGPPEIILHRPNPGTGFAPTIGSNSKVSPTIAYHGGPVMLGTVNVYYIWYGNWSGNSATTILTDFANSIGGSPYYNINTTYSNGSGARVANSVSFAGTAFDNYSQGSTALSDGAIQAIVSHAISSGGLPADANGVYFVLTSADVTKSGFCTSYCGWHTHGTIAGRDIKYSFIGNPDQCITACAAQSVGPNGNAGADGMVSIIAHELEEAATDPDLNAWWDPRGYENADKCAWTFGSLYRAANGAYANMHLGSPAPGGRDFLIQRNLVRLSSGNYCAKGLIGSVPIN
jgi:hypothetical protein